MTAPGIANALDCLAHRYKAPSRRGKRCVHLELVGQPLIRLVMAAARGRQDAAVIRAEPATGRGRQFTDIITSGRPDRSLLCGFAAPLHTLTTSPADNCLNGSQVCKNRIWRGHDMPAKGNRLANICVTRRTGEGVN